MERRVSKRVILVSTRPYVDADKRKVIREHGAVTLGIIRYKDDVIIYWCCAACWTIDDRHVICFDASDFVHACAAFH